MFLTGSQVMRQLLRQGTLRITGDKARKRFRAQDSQHKLGREISDYRKPKEDSFLVVIATVSSNNTSSRTFTHFLPLLAPPIPHGGWWLITSWWLQSNVKVSRGMTKG